MQPEGELLIQLYVPTGKFVSRQKKTFQFQMFDYPEGGRVIKEIIRKYLPESQIIHIEERYRVRPMQRGLTNSDWSSAYTVAAFPADRWLSLFDYAGFTPTNIYGDIDGSPYDKVTSSSLFATLALQ